MPPTPVSSGPGTNSFLTNGGIIVASIMAIFLVCSGIFLGHMGWKKLRTPSRRRDWGAELIEQSSETSKLNQFVWTPQSSRTGRQSVQDKPLVATERKVQHEFAARESTSFDTNSRHSFEGGDDLAYRKASVISLDLAQETTPLNPDALRSIPQSGPRNSLVKGPILHSHHPSLEKPLPKVPRDTKGTYLSAILDPQTQYQTVSSFSPDTPSFEGETRASSELPTETETFEHCCLTPSTYINPSSKNFASMDPPTIVLHPRSPGRPSTSEHPPSLTPTLAPSSVFDPSKSGTRTSSVMRMASEPDLHLHHPSPLQSNPPTPSRPSTQNFSLPSPRRASHSHVQFHRPIYAQPRRPSHPLPTRSHTSFPTLPSSGPGIITTASCLPLPSPTFKGCRPVYQAKPTHRRTASADQTAFQPSRVQNHNGVRNTGTPPASSKPSSRRSSTQATGKRTPKNRPSTLVLDHRNWYQTSHTSHTRNRSDTAPYPPRTRPHALHSRSKSQAHLHSWTWAQGVQVDGHSSGPQSAAALLSVFSGMDVRRINELSPGLDPEYEYPMTPAQIGDGRVEKRRSSLG